MKNKNYLDFIPVIKGNVSYETCSGAAGSEITVFVSHSGFWDRIAQKFFRKSKISSIKLEGQGNFIFPLIDGNKSVYDIALAVREHFGADSEPVFDRVALFMKLLERNNLISYL